MKISGVPITRVNDVDVARRLTMLIWGDSGAGKTTLACTAPGTKLLLNFDPDGTSSVAWRDDLLVADYSAQAPLFADKFKGDDGLGLRTILQEHEDIDTVIVDSLTNVSQLALMHGVNKTKGATIERPSPGAYQVRNALTLQLVKGILRTTGKFNRHCIFIAHEASPVTNDEGIVLFITVMLGGQLPNQATIDFSEVINLSVTDKGEQRIALRPVRGRKPMKTRMFDATKAREFVWKYNPETGEGDGIATWYEKWQESGYRKIKVPTGK